MNSEVIAPDEHRRITCWGRSDDTLVTMYGVLTYEEWCQFEVLRLTRLGQLSEIREKDGRIAVVRI